MTVEEAIAAVFLKATGKTTTLTSGTKFNRIVGLLDFYQRRWSKESDIDWASLYDPAFSIGTVTTTDTYDLDTSTVRKISQRLGDPIRILWADGEGYTDYDLVDADTLKDYYSGQNKENYSGYYCARIGNTLVFNHTFTEDDQEYGGEITVPCYTYASAISADALNDDIQVDDPDWLVLICAAEYVRNDITRRSRYPEILREANAAMERMKDDQDGQVQEVDRPWTPGMYNDSPWS